MLELFTSFFEIDGCPARREGDVLMFGEKFVPIVNGIPRFVGSQTYSEGNFSRLREKHATLQLDSRNGTKDRWNTVLERTGWSPEALAGKWVLECGCGAGPDTEILLSCGANVLAVDLVGTDTAKSNLMGLHSQYCIAQADITDLPLRERSFDVVFCHRVLQHTPNPEKTLSHILNFVKPDGLVFVHSYARTVKQMLNWKYLLRPVTKRLPPEVLYRIIAKLGPVEYRISEVLCSLPGGRYLQYGLVPFRYYGHDPTYMSMPQKSLIEYGVHDTFDALAPKYDIPISAKKMRRIAAGTLERPFEVVERGTITILRSLP